MKRQGCWDTHLPGEHDRGKNDNKDRWSSSKAPLLIPVRHLWSSCAVMHLVGTETETRCRLLDVQGTRSRVKASCFELFFHGHWTCFRPISFCCSCSFSLPSSVVWPSRSQVQLLDSHRLLSFLFLRFVDSSLCSAPRRPSFVFPISSSLGTFSFLHFLYSIYYRPTSLRASFLILCIHSTSRVWNL